VELEVLPRMPMPQVRTAGALCVAAFSLVLPFAARAQMVMQGSGPGSVVRIFNTDSAILESGEERKDLPCSVTPVKPALGFDLRFHAGYDVTVPLRELAGSEDLLTMIFRVSPENRPEEPIYFSQRINVPSIHEDAKGEAYLQGSFDLGEGKYKVEWLMRDRSERVCSSFWDAEATLPAKDKDVQLAIQPGEIQAAEREPFKEEPPVERNPADGPLNVKVMVNFAPQNSLSATLRPLDVAALLSILRNINREPRITRFSVVAFNMQEQRVVYRRDNADRIDFPSLGDSLEGLKLGTVDVKKLAEKHSDSAFLSNLINKELAGEKQPDAVIFAGPKVMLDEKVSEETLKQLGELDYPVFYMNYNLNPHANPWRDAIGSAVKYFKGAEYTISRPRDLFYAWTDIMSRIVKSKLGRSVSTAASR
jgi:hypothetical protein